MSQKLLNSNTIVDNFSTILITDNINNRK